MPFFEPEMPGQEENGGGNTFSYRPETTNHYVRSSYFLFKGLEQLVATNPKATSAIQICLWGKIPDEHQKLAENLGISSLVDISGSLSKEDNLKMLESMDVLFLPMEIGKNGYRSLFIPGKVYEYLLLRKPILGIGGDSDARELLENSGCAFLFDHEDQVGIVNFLNRLVEDFDSIQIEPNEELIKSKSFDVLAGDLANVLLRKTNSV